MIRKIVPVKFKKKVRRLLKKHFHFKDDHDYYQEFLLATKVIEEAIPKYDLEKRHIANSEMLLDRNELLSRMPRGKVCAEIGVNEGAFSAEILKKTSPSKLHLIDAWGDESRYHDGLKMGIEEKFADEIKNGVVEINAGFSTSVLQTIPDAYFDWVYLDTDHSYELTSKELDLLNDKVKPGGLIAGHDYIIGNWAGNVRYGVIEAVHELCLKSNWEIVFLTINKNESPSFAIRRIQ